MSKLKLLQNILDTFYFLNDRYFNINSKTKKLVVCIYFIIINIYFMLVMSNFINIRAIYKVIITIILIFLLCILLKPKERVNLSDYLSNKFIYMWVLFSIISILTSIINKSSNIIATTPLLLFPFVWIYIRKEMLEYINSIAIAAIISLLILLILNISIAPIESSQYFSILNSPIGLCNYLTTLLPLIFYLLENTNKKYLQFLIICFISINISYIVYSGSRTGLLCCIFIIFIWIIYLLINLKKTVLESIVKIGLMCLMSFICINFFSTIHNQIYNCVIAFTDKNDSTNDNEADIIEDDGLTESNTNNNESEIIKDDESEQGNLNTFLDRIDMHDKSLNVISAGRIDIWKEYLSHMNLLGHKDTSDISVTVDYKGESFGSISAHNTFIQVAYEYGIFGGLVFLLICLFAIFKTFFESISTKYSFKLFLVLSIIGNFIAVSCFNSTFYFYNYINVFYFLIFCSYLISNQKTKTTDFKMNKIQSYQKGKN